MGKSDSNIPDGPIRIDIASVLAQRLGSRSRLVPQWLVRRIERLIRQDELNELLRVAYPRRGTEFCEAVIEHLGITLRTRGTENLPAPGDTRVICVCNHPLGGLDGMALIAFVKRHCGVEPLFVVNDLLMAVEPLADVFLPVNKHGAQSRGAIRTIDTAMESDRPIIIFPAGLCSRDIRGKVTDLAWRKMFVQKAREYKRDIVPLRFEGKNSPTFYRCARWRERLGLKFNFEMILLPGEIFKARGKTFSISVAPVVSHNSIGNNTVAEVERIRNISETLDTVYNNEP